jgi:hypothetical protein
VRKGSEMLIKEAVREDCPTCGRFVKEVSPEQHGCDECRKPIVPYGNDERLDIAVFRNNAETKHYFFCSWKCVFKFAKKIKTDHFFTLPYVSFDNTLVGRRAKDFMREIAKVTR